MSQTKMAQIEMTQIKMPLGTVLKSWRKSSLRRGLVALGLLGGAIAAVAAPANIGLVGGKTGDFETTAPYVILLDAATGTILFEKYADTPTPPSSMTKLMTAEVVFNELKQGHITLDTEYMTSENAWRKGGAPSHTSSMFLPIHSKSRVEDLIQGAVVQSGNDACITLAEGLAGNERAFAEKMNARARELGLQKSNFANSTGLPDAAQKMSVRDLLQLAPGAVVELDRLAGEPLDVLVNGVRIARGEVVVVNEKFGIRLTDVVSETERMEHAK